MNEECIKILKNCSCTIGLYKTPNTVSAFVINNLTVNYDDGFMHKIFYSENKIANFIDETCIGLCPNIPCEESKINNFN